MSSVLPAQPPTGRRLRPDWEPRLYAWLATADRVRGGLGTRDCALFAADAVRAQTDWDPAAGLRGTYRNERQAARIIARHGGLAGLGTALLGPPLSSPLLARTGDVGLIEEPLAEGGDAVPRFAVVIVDRLVAQADEGLAWRPRSALVVAWPVGRAPE